MGLNILIVGAGIGGLAAAVALRQASHRVTVLEKYENKKEVGFAVSVPPNSARVLRSFGIDFKRARMSAFEGIEYAMVDSFPFKIFAHHPLTDAEGKYGAPSLASHRVDLHNALRELATMEGGEGLPVDVREGVSVVGYDPEGGSVTVQDGSVMKADLVVAADGVKSKAHKWIIGEERPATLSRLSNVRFCMSTETLESNPKLKDTLIKGDLPTIYRGKNPDVGMFRYPCRDNTLHNFGCYQILPSRPSPSVESKWRAQTTRQVLLDRLAGMDDRMLEIARVADPDEMYLWKVADRDPIPKFQKGRMIVMGDAAHPMQPTFGMGASFSIEDAGVLGVVMDGVKDPREVEERLKLWEDLRWKRDSLMQCFSDMNRMDVYEVSEETKGKIRELWPEENEWPELTRPGVNDWCLGYECLKEARRAVDAKFGGQKKVVNEHL